MDSLLAATDALSGNTLIGKQFNERSLEPTDILPSNTAKIIPINGT